MRKLIFATDLPSLTEYRSYCVGGEHATYEHAHRDNQAAESLIYVACWFDEAEAQETSASLASSMTWFMSAPFELTFVLKLTLR